MIINCQLAGRNGAFQQMLLALEFLHGILGLPLEGGEGLRNKSGGAHGYIRALPLGFAGIVIVRVHHSLTQTGNPVTSSSVSVGRPIIK